MYDQSKSLLCLPPEIMSKVLNFCSINDVLNLQKVNHKVIEKSGIFWDKYQSFKKRKLKIYSYVAKVQSYIRKIDAHIRKKVQSSRAFLPDIWCKSSIKKVSKLVETYYFSGLLTQEHHNLLIWVKDSKYHVEKTFEFENSIWFCHGFGFDEIHYFDPMYWLLVYMNCRLYLDFRGFLTSIATVKITT